MKKANRTPSLVTDKRFRSRVRDLLVELPNLSPGLGLLVAGDENVVMVFPRAGRAIKTFEDLLSLTWYRVDSREPVLDFEPLGRDAAKAFFRDLRPAPAPDCDFTLRLDP